MTVKVKDMTAEELQKLIAETVNNVMEDILGLSSEKYLKSIKEARKEYKDGKFTKIEDLP